MTVLYGITSCDTCRSARRWLEDHDIAHQYHDIRRDGLDAELVQRWQTEVGWESLVNKRSITWRKIPSVDREDLDVNKARELILSYPTVLKRPVVDTGANVFVGFDAGEFAARLGR